MPTIVDEYISRHPRSAAMAEEARTLFPSGVTHHTRYLSPFAVTMDHAAGPRKWDLDGNEYIDFVSGHGSLILGHGHPRIVEAVRHQAERGTHLGGSTAMEVRWGQCVRELIPSAQKIRFHSSGTEAVMMALRLARAFTGKNVVVTFHDHFHGWYDGVCRGGPAHLAAGVASDALHNVLTLPRVEVDAVDRVLTERSDVAAVILEPTGAHMGTHPVEGEAVRGLREVTSRHGVILIMDEVVTGFRITSGGAQKLLGVAPDLTTMAKILGGGLPGGAVAGRADILDLISFREDPSWNTDRRVAHQGTFNANPLSAAAGIACLELLSSSEPNAAADRSGARLLHGLNDLFERRGFPAYAFGMSSLVHVLLGVRCADDPRHCRLPAADIDRGIEPRRSRLFRQALMNAGVDIMGRNILITSAAHGEAEIDRAVEGCERAMLAMQAEGAL